MRLLSGHHVDRSARQLAGLTALAAALSVAASVGMAYVAGFDAVWHRLQSAQWWWLAPSFGAVLLAFTGYYYAYCGVTAAEDGPELARPALLAIVIAAFGGFLGRGGTALDDSAMRAGGASEREAKVRTGALAAFEHGTLALIVCPAAIVALIAGDVIPRTDLSWPWALIPPPAFVIGMWAAERYRDRLRDRAGWRGRLGVFFDTAHVVYCLIAHPRRHRFALAGMAVFWGADMFALWAATAAFGYRMSVVAVILALGTGMLFTRRTAPLGGAGVLMVTLVPTLWYGAAVPYASATLGVAAYRFLTVWVPLPAALAVLPKLREIARAAEGGERGAARGWRRSPGCDSLVSGVREPG